MPYFLVAIGLAMIITGARDTYAQAGSMVAADVTGSNGGAGFAWYMVGIGGVGALGAVPQLRSFSHLFMALIIVSLLINNRGVFAQFTQALKSLPAAGTPSSAPQLSTGPAAPTLQADTQNLLSSPIAMWGRIKSLFGGTAP